MIIREVRLAACEKKKKAGLGMKLLEAEKIDKNLGLRARS
jgi:hypothetical protein